MAGPYQGWVARRWTAFRAWPLPMQVLAWLAGCWVLIPLYSWRRSGADFR